MGGDVQDLIEAKNKKCEITFFRYALVLMIPKHGIFSTYLISVHEINSKLWKFVGNKRLIEHILFVTAFAIVLR